MNDLINDAVMDDPASRNLRGIRETRVGSMTVLSPKDGRAHRRVLYLNSYGMAEAWRLALTGDPAQHLWGCPELARRGYEVAMPEEPKNKGRFFNYRRQDRRHMFFAMKWLRRGDIVYSAHTVLFWIPLLVSLKMLRCSVVTLLYARGESLRLGSAYKGVIGLTPASAEKGAIVAPNAKVAHLGWGVDLPVYKEAPYKAEWFLCCGKTRRDFGTLAHAARRVEAPIRVINTQLPQGISWPSNVQQLTGGQSGSWETIDFSSLVRDHYAGCSAALILLQEDREERYGAGFTQMIEAMALARPVIVTRTGALASEIDVEKERCGIHVPPNDPASLAAAMKWIIENPSKAQDMGRAGRKLCEKRYNLERFGTDLHGFFSKL